MNTHRPTTRILRNATLLFLLVLLLGGLTACKGYYDKSKKNNMTQKTFDDRLPGAIEAAFNKCIAPMTLSGGQTRLEPKPLDTCDPGDLDDETLGIALAIQSQKIKFAEKLPSEVISDTRKNDLDKPVNCDVSVDYTAYFDKASLSKLTAKWKEVQPGDYKIRIGDHSRPSMRFEADFGTQKVGHLEASSNVNCSQAKLYPKAKKQAIKDITSTLRNEVDGKHDIEVKDLKVDIDVIFKDENYKVAATPRVFVSLADLNVELDWSKVEKVNLPWPFGTVNVLDRSDIEDPAQKILDRRLQSILEKSLANVSKKLAKGMNKAVEGGRHVCDVRPETKGGNTVLVLETSDSKPCPTTGGYVGTYDDLDVDTNIKVDVPENFGMPGDPDDITLKLADGTTKTFKAIEKSKAVKNFYDYRNYASHTGMEDAKTVKLMVYHDTKNDVRHLVVLGGSSQQNNVGVAHFEFDVFSGNPKKVGWVLKDDPSRLPYDSYTSKHGAAKIPDSSMQNGTLFTARWRWRGGTDGGIIGPLSAGYVIQVTPGKLKNVDKIELVGANGVVAELPKDDPVVISKVF